MDGTTIYPEPVYSQMAGRRHLETIFYTLLLFKDVDIENLSMASTCVKVHESVNGRAVDKTVSFIKNERAKNFTPA